MIAPAGAPLIPPGAGAGLLQRLGSVALAMPALALVQHAAWPRGPGFDVVLVRTAAISLLIWAGVDLGRHLLRRPLGAAAPPHWPPPGRAALLLTAATLLGWVGGSAIGEAYAGTGAGWGAIAGQAAIGGLVLTVAVSLVFALVFHQRGRAEALARQARDARLAALQAQLEPHMLFNTFANLRALIAADPPQAIAMLDRLNGYFRRTLAAARTAEHSLGAELDRIEDYLALMAIRMGERLATEIRVAAALRDVLVPALVLQPLVENALRHGLEPSPAGGRLTVTASAAADRLVLEVADTGLGLAPEAGRGGGFGLAQLRERLAGLHGAAAGLVLQASAGPEGGTVATIRLPLRRA